MTLNATPSVIQLYQYVSRNDKKDTEEGSEAAARRVEIMREVGLKTISFNGIPKVCVSGPDLYIGLRTDRNGVFLSRT